MVLTLQTGLLAVSLLAVAAVIYNISRNLTAPMEAIRAYAGKVASGGTDVRMDGEFIHEIADLRDSICGMVDNLNSAMESSRKSRAEAERHAAEARDALERSRAQENELKSLLSNMNSAARKARSVSENIFGAIGELTVQVERVQQGVDIQHDRMTETATAMEEMTGTVYEVARNASSAAESAERSRNNAETGAAGVREAVGSIHRVEQEILGLKATMTQLGAQADNIGQIITVINDIADQTNLLALNAAIEAARAGEAGRGFAVVADEVRKLAEKTMSATKEVGDAVTQIQARARENVAAVEAAAEDIVKSTSVASESGRFMEEIVGIVESTAVQVDSIATASEEQSAASEEINRAVSDVTRVAQETAEGMELSSRALVEVSGLVEELDMIIQGMASGRLESAVSTERLVEWTDDLSVGVKLIDEQHMVLIDLINELHAAMRSRKSDTIMLDVVARLKDYTVKHFGTEEELFARYGYADAAAHKEVHDRFVQKVAEFESGLKSGTARVTMDIMRFLKDWLVKHIQGTDKRYGPFLNEKGVY